MHLALAIGGCTLDELDERMDEREFFLWEKYARAFFLPQRRADLQAAQTAYLVAVTMGGAKTSTKLSDFLVVPAIEDESMTAEVGSSMIGAVTAARVYRLGQGRKAKG